MYSLIKFQGQKNELKTIHSTEEFQLERSVMTKAPHTDTNTNYAQKYQRYEDLILMID